MFKFYKRINNVYLKKTQKSTKINLRSTRVKRLKTKFILSKKLLC